jgi:hypothetical protein
MYLARHTDTYLCIARVDYRIFERISNYDARSEYGILARRKANKTTEWLRSDKTFTSWLENEDTAHNLWISGKGKYDMQVSGPTSLRLTDAHNSRLGKERIDVRRNGQHPRSRTDYSGRLWSTKVSSILPGTNNV